MNESTSYQASPVEGRIAEMLIAYLVAYQEGYQEGRLEEARRLLFLLGAPLFGPPDDEIIAIVQNNASIDGLEAIIDRLIHAENWAELLAN